MYSVILLLSTPSIL